MATLSSNNPTLLDFKQSLDPNGMVANTIEVLTQENEILGDMTSMEGNLPTGHRHVVRTGLPTPTWRKMYGGVQPTKSTRVQVTDACGMLEAYAEVDKALADLNGNTLAFRANEDRAFVEGMGQEVASTLIYGDESTSPEEFTGLAPRYNSLSAENADNIINASGSDSDNTSIWLVVWGPQTCFSIYPKGSTAGLSHTDKGQVTIEDADGSNGRMEAYRSHYRWDVGLALPDWRSVGRICNIDVSDLGTLANTKNLITNMVMLSERIEGKTKGRACWYVNRTIREKLRLGILEKVTNNLSFDSVEGKMVMNFDDIPVKVCDAILNTESAVS
jgi:hypothetical protein